MTRWVFFHVEKTGGSGLCEYLKRELGDRVIDLRRGVRWEQVKPTGNEWMLTGHGTYWRMWRGLWDDDVRCFTYWREPAERLWSQWKAICAERGQDLDGFQRWVSGQGERLCYCLLCRWSDPHTSNPTVNNIGARIGYTTLAAAAGLLDLVTVVPIERVDEWQHRVLFPSLGLSGAGYERLRATSPEPISIEDRKAVYRANLKERDLYHYGMSRAWH